MSTNDPPPDLPSEPTVLEVLEDEPNYLRLSNLPRAGKANIAFFASDGTPALEFLADGRIFVRGREAITDLDLVDRMREFLRDTRDNALVHELRAILEALPHESLADAARRAMRR